MRILITILLSVLSCSADLRTNGQAVDTLDYYSLNSSVIGDTAMMTSWTGSGDGGNFNGGRIFGSANDATGWCPSGGNMNVLELVTLNWSAKASTSITCANSMSGYGSTSQINFPAGWSDGKTWKNFNLLAYNGDLYMWPYRQNQSPPYYGFQSTVIMSPDKGLHWCNHETYAAHSGSPGCDSSNWSVAGDAPASNTHMAFGAAGSSNNPMARPITVQFCQDETCTGGLFDSDNYLYFTPLDGNDYVFSACVAKSRNAIMDPAQTWYWKGGNATCGDAGSWTHTAASAVRIQRQSPDGADAYGYPASVAFISQSGKFLMTTYDGGGLYTMFMTADYPWGPYKRVVSAPSLSGITFPSVNLAWLDASCSGCNTNPGKWELGMVNTIYTHSGSGTFQFVKLPFTTTSLNTPNTPTRGKNTLGRLPLRVSKDGLNKTLIGKNLRFVTLFDDYIDYASGDFSGYASMYTRDLLGSGMCLAGGQNAAGGAVVFGAQNGTASLSYGTAGLHLGDQYMSQLHSNAGNCSFTLPSTMSGNSSFTVITVLAMDVVSKQQGMIWELQPIGSGAAHNGISFGTNINVEGGSHVDVYDNNVTLRTNPGLTAGQYNMITYVKSAGAFQTTSTVYFGDGSGTKKWCNSGCGSGWNFVSGTDSGTLNLSSSAVLTLNCATFASAIQCKNGGTNSSSQGILSGTFSFFAIYDRALSATEVAQNYRVIKAALAQAPRSITVQ